MPDSNSPYLTQVSDAAIEFLMTEILRYIERSTPPAGGAEEQAIFAKEMAAAKMERMGYSVVGFCLCERLSQNRTFAASAVGKNPASIAAAAQLEAAVKFLCKEVWIEVFRKQQIDKLQTNHRPAGGLCVEGFGIEMADSVACQSGISSSCSHPTVGLPVRYHSRRLGKSGGTRSR
jgi:hypothetical protein